ncbi:SIMPL domain-containing protein [Clostridiales bacterium]|nr:SIMPL domain-containing protein [Clostridiales bacterium]
MRKLTALILALMVLAASAAALADTEITVSGEGNILVSADTAVVNIGVNIRDKNALKAQQHANEVIAAVRKTLTENGIAAEDINTGYVELFTIYDYDYSSGSDAVSMYTANSMLAIQLKDMTQVGKVIDLAFGAGANSLNGVSFSASDTDAARKEALKAAVEQARVKAEVLAEAAGLKITGIEAINEGGTYSFDSGLNNFRSKGMADEAAVAETVVQAAKIQVNSTVNITFKAE